MIMNSLKFVEEEIEQNKRLFERYTNHLLAFPSSIIENGREEIREELTYLQQIKKELEEYNEIKKYGISYDNFKSFKEQ